MATTTDGIGNENGNTGVTAGASSPVITPEQAAQERMERIRQAEIRNAARNEAEKAIVGAIASLAVKYNALEDLANIDNVSIPALLALANEKGVTSADLQNTMSLVQIYVLQLQAVEGGTWADCWDGMKERFAMWLAEINGSQNA